MKYDFWFELPVVLMSLISQDYLQEDHMIANLLNKSYKVYYIIIFHNNSLILLEIPNVI